MCRTVIAVFGGRSNENEISVITGTMAANVLAAGGDKVLPVYISREGKFYYGKELSDVATFKNDGYAGCAEAFIAAGGLYVRRRGNKFAFYGADCVLNCCHGGFGEGGGLAGVCAAAGLPMAGAGIFESSAFMDKYLTKIVLGGLGAPVLPCRYVREGEEIPADILFPVIVKPANLGSSIGVAVAEDVRGLKEALDCAFIYDSAAIVEKYLCPRREINCAAYRGAEGITVSECEEAVSAGDIFSFEDKYRGGGRSVIPADLPAGISGQIRDITREVYFKLNMRGVVRFDYILSDKVYLSEVNTVPGSLAYYLFADSFRDFYAVLDSVIREAVQNFASSQKRILRTGILSELPSNACKCGKK